jgi:hypothetical protein
MAHNQRGRVVHGGGGDWRFRWRPDRRQKLHELGRAFELTEDAHTLPPDTRVAAATQCADDRPSPPGARAPESFPA